jgi:hypothetical protein
MFVTEIPINETSPSRGAVLDALQDQDGNRWVTYGHADGTATFGVHELVTSEGEVWTKLSKIGLPKLTVKSKNALKQEVEALTEFRPGIVAARPGWLDDGCFVFGDGTVLPPERTDSVVIAFDIDSRFSARGSLEEWQAGLNSLIRNQPNVAIAIAFGLVGPLLRFMPSDVNNPILELCADKQSGKTTLGISYVALWGDDPNSNLGVGTSFASTINAIEKQWNWFNDIGLLVDEVNLAGIGRKADENLGHFVFLSETGEPRRRLGDAPDGRPGTRLATLVTANDPIIQQLSAGQRQDAAASRIVTLSLGKSIFIATPPSFSRQQDAARELQTVSRANAGAVGHHFVEQLLARKWRGGLRNTLEGALRRQMTKLDEFALSPRERNTFALILLAAVAATDLLVFRKEWNAAALVMQVVRKYASKGTPTANSDVLARVQAFLVDKTLNVPKDNKDLPCEASKLDEAWGYDFYSAGERLVAIGSITFREAFPDHVTVMRFLRDRGLAKTEGGSQKKLTIKTPSAVANGGRVYCLYADRIMRS